MKFCFVILHYMSDVDTYDCVDSIERLYGGKDYHIVLVDNASPNGSGLNVFNKYKNNNNITVILEPENLGFAKGNNVAYTWARKNLEPEYLIFVNNDIIFIQEEFLDNVEKLYYLECFDVLGPDILDITQTKHQNPMRPSMLNPKDVKRIVTGKKVYVNAQEKGFIWKVLMGFYIIVQPQEKSNRDFRTQQTDCVLQGSCLIFSKKYINNHHSAFYAGTFLYFEEDILRYLLDCENGKMLYSPTLKVIHKEDKSTDMITENNKQKNIFKAKHMITSGLMLLNLMKK